MRGGLAIVGPAPARFRAYFMKRLDKRQTNVREKIITPTITMLAMFVVITPVTFSFIVVTSVCVVEATSGSTAACAAVEAKRPPKVRARAATFALACVKRFLILFIVL